MDDVEQLKRDVGAGRIDVDRLIELIVTLQRQLQAANAQRQAANKRIEELEQKQGAPPQGAPPTAKIDQPFSLRAEEQRQEKRGKKKRKPKKNGRRGRVTTAKKIAQAERTEEVLPEGFTKSECQLSHTRPVWRLENGRAVLVAYQIYRGPNNCYGKIPGVLGRSEFGMEIVVELAQMYRAFTDRLLEIYREACRVQRDGRLGDAGRSAKIAALDEAILELCGATWCADLPSLEGLANDYRLLNEELMRLMLAQQLFTFVAADPVVKPNGETQAAAGTNNEAERTLRGPAQARDTGRTNKTLVGARRQSINMSVLESLRLYLPTFTLASVTAEIKRWAAAGRSCFTNLLRSLHLSLPKTPVLERAYADLSG